MRAKFILLVGTAVFTTVTLLSGTADNSDRRPARPPVSTFLAVDHVYFETFLAFEHCVDERGRKSIEWDERPSGMFVVPRKTGPTGIRQRYDEAKAQYGSHATSIVSIVNSSAGLTIIGKLPGYGITAFGNEAVIGPARELVVTGSEILVLGTCQFSGENDKDAAPHTYYLMADLPPLPPGNYNVMVRISPAGEVFDRLLTEHWLTEVPDFGLLRCSFRVVNNQFAR